MTCQPYEVPYAEVIYSQPAAANGRYLVGTTITTISCNPGFLIAAGRDDLCLETGEWRNTGSNSEACEGIYLSFSFFRSEIP